MSYAEESDEDSSIASYHDANGNDETTNNTELLTLMTTSFHNKNHLTMTTVKTIMLLKTRMKHKTARYQLVKKNGTSFS